MAGRHEGGRPARGAPPRRAAHLHRRGRPPLPGFLTDLDDPDVAYLEALQRGRGRAEKRICDLKDTGLANLPSAGFALNAAWLATELVAHDVLAWSRLLVLDGALARAEPKRLRHCLLHAAAGVVARSGRRTRLRIAVVWPWVADLVAAFERVRTLRLRI